MFFLFRLTFWLGLVLVLLPRERTPATDKLPQIDASQAVQAATAAVSDVSQFCKRQPAACEVGSQAATVIGVRAQEGARKLYQIVTDKKANEAEKKASDADRKPPEIAKKPPEHTGSIGNATEADAAPAQAASQDTLTADDLAIGFRGTP